MQILLSRFIGINCPSRLVNDREANFLQSHHVTVGRECCELAYKSHRRLATQGGHLFTKKSQYQTPHSVKTLREAGHKLGLSLVISRGFVWRKRLYSVSDTKR